MTSCIFLDTPSNYWYSDTAVVSVSFPSGRQHAHLTINQINAPFRIQLLKFTAMDFSHQLLIMYKSTGELSIDGPESHECWTSVKGDLALSCTTCAVLFVEHSNIKKWLICYWLLMNKYDGVDEVISACLHSLQFQWYKWIKPTRWWRDAPFFDYTISQLIALKWNWFWCFKVSRHSIIWMIYPPVLTFSWLHSDSYAVLLHTWRFNGPNAFITFAD